MSGGRPGHGEAPRKAGPRLARQDGPALLQPRRRMLPGAESKGASSSPSSSSFFPLQTTCTAARSLPALIPFSAFHGDSQTPCCPDIVEKVCLMAFVEL